MLRTALARLSLAATLAWIPGTVRAHASEQALVLLMPTDVYLAVGTGIVALTALLLALLPDRKVRHWMGPAVLSTLPGPPSQRQSWPGLVVTLLLFALVALGLFGPHDPLANLLPLTVWTLWWIGFTTLTGLLGDGWPVLNPWSGLLRHGFGQPADAPGLHRLPSALGRWPAIVSLLAFMAFVLADPAPDDPSRLAILVAFYWASTLLLMLVFGERDWLQRGELFSAVFAGFGALAVRVTAMLRGSTATSPAASARHRIASDTALARSGAVFCLVLLGAGSFDGLNESFFWLDIIGVNPFEYPGRSALIGVTIGGMLGFVVLLVAAFALCVALGHRLAGAKCVPLGHGFDALAPTVLPIAFGYHLSHYLASFLVDGQYAIVAISDPLGNGANWLGLKRWFVSTGFFNTPATVRSLWFAQAAAVVGGHLLAILLAHRAALSLFGDGRRARLSQVPLVLFMVGYTLFGLWLLATPRAA